MSKSQKVGIIDYGLGNIYSVNKACEFIGLKSVVISKKTDLKNVDAIILPGVGAFGNAMENLKKLDIIDSIKKEVNNGKPILGICLGMQLLMQSSDEFGHHKGIGLINGDVIKFPEKDDQNLKIPQIQWNKININPSSGNLLKGIPNDTYFYFLHSFFVRTKNFHIITATAEYKKIKYCCVIEHDNIFATQFHPEKSTNQGIKILNNFKNYINNGK
tara:strand:+ start:547 stop:1194 length:648 start_codon:yes stop_codon:yes gene_type:complete